MRQSNSVDPPSFLFIYKKVFHIEQSDKLGDQRCCHIRLLWSTFSPQLVN